MASSPPPKVGDTVPKLWIRIPARPARRMSSRLLEKGSQVEGKSLSLSPWDDVGNSCDIDGIASTSATLIRKRKADGEPVGIDRPHSPKRSRIQPVLRNALLLRNRRALARRVSTAQRTPPSLPGRTEGTQILDVGTIHASTSRDATPTHPEGSSGLDNHDRVDEMVPVGSRISICALQLISRISRLSSSLQQWVAMN